MRAWASRPEPPRWPWRPSESCCTERAIRDVLSKMARTGDARAFAFAEALRAQSASKRRGQEMAALDTKQETEHKSFDNPDEVREFPNGRAEILKVGGGEVGRYTFQPGWRWSNDVKP